MTAEAASRDSDFTAFVACRRDALLRMAYLLCGDWGRAEDVVQVSLVKLYLAWRRVHTNPEAYVRTIVTRAAVDEHRRTWRREVSTADLPDSPRHLPDATAALDLRMALLQLPPRQRQVVVLRYYQQLSVLETASTLSITAGTVKSSCARGLATLNQLLSVGEELIRP